MGYGVAMPKRYYVHMSIEERETLSLGLAQGQSLRTRARVLGRAPSTVSRESARNARGHPYRACTAQHLAATRARQPRRTRTLLDPWLWQYVQTHLAQGCSPEPSAGRLRRASILMRGGSTFLQRPSMWRCTGGRVAPCTAHC